MHLPPRAAWDTRLVFKWSLTGLNVEFSFSFIDCLFKVKEISLPCYLPIAGGGRETEITSSSIWTQVADFTLYDDNRYPKRAVSTMTVVKC